MKIYKSKKNYQLLFYDITYCLVIIYKNNGGFGLLGGINYQLSIMNNQVSEIKVCIKYQ